MENECGLFALQCPKDFILYNYLEYAPHKRYKDTIAVDSCLKDEILYLWSKGIKTAGCCCGHGKYDGFINVFDDSIDNMIALGYELWDWSKAYPDEEKRPDFAKNRKDTFKTKTECRHGGELYVGMDNKI